MHHQPDDKYRTLDAGKIVETARRLADRIQERFPGSGLGQVAESLHGETQAAAKLAAWIHSPLWPAHLVAGFLIAFMGMLIVATFLQMSRGTTPFSSYADFLQGLDAGVNELILFGVATFFLCGLEARWKRRRLLQAIHSLRSLAHIIDMHQLTKDPERYGIAANTPSSPARNLTPFELARYLDYCSEMLSVISKLAALYVQDFPDPITLGAVDEVQDLTGGLSQKMWQKIMLIDRISEAA